MKFRTQGFIVGKEKTKAVAAREKDGVKYDARPETYNIAVLFGYEVKDNAGVFFKDIPSVVRAQIPKIEYLKVTEQMPVKLSVEQQKTFLNVIDIEGFTVIDWRDNGEKSKENEDEDEDEE